MSKNTQNYTQIEITAQTIADYFINSGAVVVYHKGCQIISLEGMEVFTGQPIHDDKLLYLCRKEDISLLKDQQLPAVYLVEGIPPDDAFDTKNTYIYVSGFQNFPELINYTGRLFRHYMRIRQNILEILSNDGSIDDICRLAGRHFRNPLFVHDEHFNILGSYGYENTENRFEYNEDTGGYTENVEIINLFRIDVNYKHSLKTTGGQYYSSEITGGNSLYCNIWEDQSYRGRITIQQQYTSFLPSQQDDIACFAYIIGKIITRKHISRTLNRKKLERTLIESLNGVLVEPVQFEDFAKKLDWKLYASYYAGCIPLQNEEMTRLSEKTIRYNIEKTIGNIFTFFYDSYIYFLLNLTPEAYSIEEFRGQMSYIIRDGLLKVGISAPFHSLLECGNYFEQARTALEYGTVYRPTDWYHDFQNYLIVCWLKEGFGKFLPELLLCPALKVLKQYDIKHDTELYQTLKVYLDCERNNTLTSQILQIHRSTLPYRLARIKELTGVNPEDKDTRLYLSMSFYYETQYSSPVQSAECCVESNNIR